MKFIDIGQEAHGFIAIGQIATGVIAIGQMATGVVAIGQLARGFFAVGMLAYGVLALGMVSVGVLGATGMVGLAGLGGKGAIMPLMHFPRMNKLSIVPFADVFGSAERGYVAGRFAVDAENALRFCVNDRVTDAIVLHELSGAARQHARSNSPDIIAYVDRNERGERVVTRAMKMPLGPSSSAASFIARTFALMVLAGVCAGFYVFVATPLVEFAVR